MSDASSLQISDDLHDHPASADPQIPANLKFVVSNIKNFVMTPLSADNFAIWRSQILKIIRANGFFCFLESDSPLPTSSVQNPDGSSSSNPRFANWHLTDQTLSAAICSTIFAAILPYVISLDSTSAIWKTLESRFQSSNRSKVIQLKNALHNVTLKSSTMTQYLSEIRSLVDQISAAGSTVDIEDIILYILNDLPHTYQSFKTSIRTMLMPISLDQLYPLLLSEEINLAADADRQTHGSDPTHALFNYRGRGKKSRGKPSSTMSGPPRPNPNSAVVCQICPNLLASHERPVYTCYKKRQQRTSCLFCFSRHQFVP
ncbi:hypothetical protein KFK09_022332 [Dendrobium nobile]|uniref:Retrovirus-related Pol polyprotein from transposon TNT 1-94 n=1 Tax=Dendrobium nobile TaxID=94219 RepID=A0A8T3API0_DENNO|nr:hypothetical protein KFK09_022332 [Dendrobium nobile]